MRSRRAVHPLIGLVLALAFLGTAAPAATARPSADRLADPGYVYDPNGSLVADPSRSYAYDALGRLTGVSGPGLEASYTLDGLGDRVGQTVNGVSTAFVLDVAAPNPTILADGTRTYLPGSPAAGYEEGGLRANGLTDVGGSLQQTVSETGAVGPPARYDPYGGLRSGALDPSGVGYASEYGDASGLLNLRARAYDPALGRFLGRDPEPGLLAAPLTGNPYLYALANPARYVDPSGRFVAQVLVPGSYLLDIGLQSVPGFGDALAAGSISSAGSASSRATCAPAGAGSTSSGRPAISTRAARSRRSSPGVALGSRRMRWGLGDPVRYDRVRPASDAQSRRSRLPVAESSDARSPSMSLVCEPSWTSTRACRLGEWHSSR